MDTKVSYEQIAKANSEMEMLKLGAKNYAQVNQRIKAYRKVYPTGKITTEIQEVTEDYARVRAVVTDEEDNIIATGTATEKLTGDARKDNVNLTSMIENCETSAVGRALGFAGFGVDTAIASAEDIEKSKANAKLFEIYKDMFIHEEEAKKIIKVSIGELMRKHGVVKAALAEVVEKELWTSLEEMNSHQLRKLEEKLKTLNMESNSWHSLYNENTKIKDVVPINQEVVYESSWVKFGKIALEQAGTDELLRNDIIDSYLDFGFNLEG
jgi:homoserine trans-succinylase